ncbi:MAG: hypothetical protein ACUVWK_04015 [Nitrososphaerales archaeon]
MGFLGTRAIWLSDVNLLLQIVVLAILILGISFAKKKRLVEHGRVMTLAVALNAVLIVFIMIPSLIGNVNTIMTGLYTAGVLITLGHAILGGIAETLGAILVFRKFGKVKTWMRIEASVWFVAVILGPSFYAYYYVI